MPTLDSIRKSKERKELVRSKLGRVFYRRDLEKLVSDLVVLGQFSEATAKRLVSSSRLLDGDWIHWKEPFLYAFEPPTNIFDVFHAICSRKGFYLSHYTAIYLNDLVEQRPREHFVTSEKMGKAVPKPSGPLNPFNVRQAFLKPARVTSNHFTFLDQKVSMLEKPWLGYPGVESKTLAFEDHSLTLKITGLHRTFLDSVIAPHQSGGLGTIVKAFRDQKVDPDELFELYQVLNPTYPFWQSIGFLLERFDQTNAANRWARYFSHATKVPFYLAREAKSNWAHSQDWNLHYPPGIFEK